MVQTEPLPNFTPRYVTLSVAIPGVTFAPMARSSRAVARFMCLESDNQLDTFRIANHPGVKKGLSMLAMFYLFGPLWMQP